jgi:hypothetical protein
METNPVSPSNPVPAAEAAPTVVVEFTGHLRAIHQDDMVRVVVDPGHYLPAGDIGSLWRLSDLLLAFLLGMVVAIMGYGCEPKHPVKAPTTTTGSIAPAMPSSRWEITPFPSPREDLDGSLTPEQISPWVYRITQVRGEVGLEN